MDAWATLFDTAAKEDNEGFIYLGNLLCYFMAPEEPTNLAEILEATDGLRGFSSLVVKFGSVFPALVSAGITGPFTSALCESTISHEDFEELLLECFQVLAHLFVVQRSHKAMCDTIGAGLLHAIIRSSIICEGAEGLESSSLWDLLDVRLLSGTIASTPAFQDSFMHENWQCFVYIALESIELMNASPKALWGKSTTALRIAKTDWRKVGHRDTCHWLRISRLENSNLRTRDLSFMRAILDPDSIRLVDEERLSFNAREDKDRDVCWAEHVARAARSRRRMELHLRIFSDGDRLRRWMFPSRSDHSTLYDGMTRTLHEVPRDSDGQEEIEALLGANEDLILIHQ
ncbi:hypothetical protein B0H19DRAFT_1263558 [Mycena capillaripes]|nr:hypothetical protein B0H19DRAFT_1263558 [Mycena capillaripes]